MAARPTGRTRRKPTAVRKKKTVSKKKATTLKKKVKRKPLRDMTPEELKASGMKPPWKPGQSGNPKGRPKNRHRIETLVRERLLFKSKRKDCELRIDELAEGIILLMLKDKNVKMVSEYLEREWPKTNRVVLENSGVLRVNASATDEEWEDEHG